MGRRRGRSAAGSGRSALGALQLADYSRQSVPVEPRNDTQSRDTAEECLQQHAPGPGVEIGNGRPLERDQKDDDEQGSTKHRERV